MKLSIKSITGAVLGLLLLASCAETRYKDAQPFEKRERSTFPSAMRGSFVDSDGDTFKIKKNAVVGIKNEAIGSKGEYLPISDSLKVKKYKGYCFMSLLTHNNHWNVFLVDYSSKSSLHVYAIDPESKRIRDLKKITQVEEFRNDKGKLDYILLNPTKRDWRKILRKDIPEIELTYRRID